MYECLITEKVRTLDISPGCRSLFENFFHSACPWFRYELQWIPKRETKLHDSPLLVVLLSVSRLKNKVEAALENIKYTGNSLSFLFSTKYSILFLSYMIENTLFIADNIMLIVIHNCEPSLRPNKLLRSCEDRRVVAFTNILIWNDSVYGCPINNKAKQDIRLYLRQNVH
jgi:hypothetical protein